MSGVRTAAPTVLAFTAVIGNVQHSHTLQASSFYSGCKTEIVLYGFGGCCLIIPHSDSYKKLHISKKRKWPDDYCRDKVAKNTPNSWGKAATHGSKTVGIYA